MVEHTNCMIQYRRYRSQASTRRLLEHLEPFRTFVSVISQINLNWFYILKLPHLVNNVELTSLQWCWRRVMLVTLWRWVTIDDVWRCWRPTSQACHQHKVSPIFVININVVDATSIWDFVLQYETRDLKPLKKNSPWFINHTNHLELCIPRFSL